MQQIEEAISLGDFLDKSKKETVPPRLVTVSLNIAYAVGFDISDVQRNRDYYQSLFGEIANEDVKEILNNIFNLPRPSLTEAATIFVSQSERDKKQVKKIVKVIGFSETMSCISKFTNLWNISDISDISDIGENGKNGKNGKNMSSKTPKEKGTMLLSTQNAFYNLNHIIEVAEFLSCHDF